MVDPLRRLLDLPQQEKGERGLVHTPREIWQQPDTWSRTLAHCQEKRPDLQKMLRSAGISRVTTDQNATGRGARAFPRVYLVGAGTSDYTGRALTPLLRRRWGGDVWAVPSTTLLTDFDDFHRTGSDYFWISFSRSGDSPEGAALLERALDRHPGIRHIVVTCNEEGQMARLCARHGGRAFALVLDEAVNDRGLAMTSSFTNMLLAGHCIAHLEDLAEFGEIVGKIAETGRSFLSAAAEVTAAITSLGCTRACFVGSGALRAVADESSLKVVELTAGKVTTLSETPLGLRHGPLSSVDSQTVFVAFLSSEPRRRGYELDLLRELDRKRLARVRLAVTTSSDDDVSSLVDYCLTLDWTGDFPDVYRPLVDVMVGQLIGLFASMRCGLKPDQPSPNGAITRVVQPITLYS